jgi:hypothetical protein
VRPDEARVQQPQRIHQVFARQRLRAPLAHNAAHCAVRARSSSRVCAASTTVRQRDVETRRGGGAHLSMVHASLSQ